MLTKRRFLINAVFWAFSSATLAGGSFIAPAFAQDIPVDHASGHADIAQNPQKLVVFDLGVMDNMTRLGVEETIVGIAQSPLPDYLERFSDKKYARVGSLFEPDYEAVAALEPDLIIVGGRSQAKYGDLAAIAPTLDLTVDNNRYLESVADNVRILGEIFDKKDQANQEITQLTQDVAQLKTLASNKGRGLLILTTGGKMSAYGPGSRFGILHSDFGVVAAASDLSVGTHGEPISFEFILETNPDWLFVIDRDAAIGRSADAAQQLLDNPVVGKTLAAEKKQIVYLNPQNWYLIGGGLSGLHQTIDQIRAAYAG